MSSQASPHAQLSLFYLFNGLLSSISDNVFVGTVYINEARTALQNGVISLPQFELLAVAINTGTNLPSVATPNGQAAFLFLLTSALAPLIRLSYGRMVWMALPYTIVMTLVGLLCVEFALMPVTQWMLDNHWLHPRRHFLKLSSGYPASVRRITALLLCNIFQQAAGVGTVFVYTAMIWHVPGK
ncbi:Sodium/proton antiporter nhaB [Raoultella planticola]|uniref:Sodium/proton antiporter nhaB n=1 Tax=Raoultella planticola TaxID=575 RepID=A0A485AUW4_RAOPL|nr:Sodium/proton antiporter nhaB [Raoultella planticola]